MELDIFRNHFLDEENVIEVSSLLGSGQSFSLKNITGSLYALTAYAAIEKTEGFHLFILPDKESALYLFNDFENIIQNQRGTTLLFYPASFRRPYQIMEADATSVLQ